MTEKRFWRTTPTQLNALSAVHAEFNSPGKEKKPVAQVVEDVPFLI